MNQSAVDRWRRQKALFQEALACEPSLRAELIADVRASDPGLADEVAAMLEAHDAEGAFLAEPFIAPVDARRDVWLGEVLEGKYRVDERLGRGGMGSVYRATHLWTGRAVAVKIIAPEFVGRPEFVERFKREAKAAGRLRHPNVVNVTDFGFGGDGLRRAAYLVMEYLDGETLAEALGREPRLPLAVVVDVLEQVCLAVDEAHRRGILHRDLKPSNIWLEPDGRGGHTVKVLDFGLAKLRELEPDELPAGDPPRVSALPGATQADLGASFGPPSLAPMRFDEDDEPESEEATRGLDRYPTPAEIDPRTIAYRLTRVGAVMGTPAYMSPEQWRSERLTPASDVYAVGVVAYEMLAGRLPFTGKAEELLVKHTEMRPPPLKGARREVTAELDRLVSSALSKSPADRPPTAGAFAAAFKAIAEGEPALAWRSRQALEAQSRSIRGEAFGGRALLALLACLGIGALATPWPVDLPGGGTLQFALWLVPLGLLLMAIDAAALGRLRDAGRAGSFVVASLATVRPAWILAVQVLAVEDGGARAALERSRLLLAPFPSFARVAFCRRLLRGLAMLSSGVVIYSVAIDSLEPRMDPGPASWTLLMVVMALITAVASARDGAARAMLYSVARAVRGEAQVVRTEAPAPPFQRRRARGPALVALAVLSSLAFGVIHLLFVPPFGPLPRAPRPMVARVPDAENAWVEYHRAILAAGFETASRSESAQRITSLVTRSQWGSMSFEGTNGLLIYSAGARPSLDESERALILANAPALEHVLAGVRRPRAQFTSDLPDFSSPIPSLIALRGLAAIVCAKARTAADGGRGAEAIDLYLAAYEMSTDVSEPSTGLIGSLIAVNGRRIVVDGIGAWLRRGGADAAAEMELARRLAELDSRMLGPAECLYDVEGGAWLRSMEDILIARKRESEEALPLFDGEILRLFGRAQGLRSRFYASTYELSAARGELRPILERWDLREFEDAQARQDAALEPWYWPPEPGAMLARSVGAIAFPSLARVGAVMYEDRFRNAALRAMLIADAYRKRHGSFPERLDEAAVALGVEVPCDVATGAAIDYRLEGGVPVVRASAADHAVRFGEARDPNKP